MLALLGLAGSCAAQPEAPQVSSHASATTLAFLNVSASRVKDLHSGPGDGLPERTKPHFALHALGDTLFLRADDGVNGPALWRSDGTEAGTRLVKDFSADTSESLGDEPVVMDGALYLFAGPPGGFGLWRLERDAETPLLVHPLSPRDPFATTAYLRVFGGHLSFMHGTGGAGTEPWVSDGTQEGTRMLKDILPGGGSAYPNYFQTLGGPDYYFTANDGTHGRELWRSDGTEAGTLLVKDLPFSGTELHQLQVLAAGDALYFVAQPDAPAAKPQLWRSDGTGAGTRLVKDFEESGDLLPPMNTALLGQRLVAASYEVSTSRQQLWAMDTASETFTVLQTASLPPSFEGVFGRFVALGDRLLFVGPGAAREEALWSTDGTAPGTRRLLDVDVHADGMDAFKVIDGLLVFAANDGVNGTELWRSDGTVEGTFQVADVRPGAEGSNPSYFALAGDTLYFRATEGQSGYELWSIPLAKVHDPFPPTLTCPADLEVTAATPDGVPVSYSAAQASDNSPLGAAVTYSHPSGSTFPMGTTRVTVVASDPAQNKAGCAFQVTVHMAPRDSTSGGCASSPAAADAWLAVLGALAWVRGRRRRPPTG